MILCRQSFFRDFESKVGAVPRRRLLLSSDNSCGTRLLFFWTFPIVCKRREIAFCITPSCSASFFSVYAECISSTAYNSSVSIFWERTRFNFKIKIFLMKFLILSFACIMTYSVLSICSTNHCSGFSSIFLLMKREVDVKSNMLFCYCHREHYWFLRLCASNAKPYDIFEGQMSTL